MSALIRPHGVSLFSPRLHHVLKTIDGNSIRLHLGSTLKRRDYISVRERIHTVLASLSGDGDANVTVYRAIEP